jgi:hypothetical protein
MRWQIFKLTYRIPGRPRLVGIVYVFLTGAFFQFILTTEEAEQSRQSAKFCLQSSELGLPNPLPAGEYAPPLIPGRRVVNSSFKWFLPVFAKRRGRGEGIHAVWGTYTVVLCINMYFVGERRRSVPWLNQLSQVNWTPEVPFWWWRPFSHWSSYNFWRHCCCWGCLLLMASLLWTIQRRFYIFYLQECTILATEYRIQRGFDIGRVQSCVLCLPKYWPPTPLSTRKVCSSPATKAGGTHALARQRGGWGVNILEETRHRIGL